VIERVDRFFFGPVLAARPWLLMKGFLLLLAFDCWIDLSPHGGRYGIGGFNVAHFGWLDVLTPTPSPAFYVGLICFCGLLALINAIGGVNRWALGVLAASYTYSWAMSMLDSYQHHYLLTLVLVPFAFYPAVSAKLLVGDESASEESPDAAKKQTKKKRKSKRKKKASKKASADPKTLPGGALCAWAYNATAWSIGIVYSYTALSKSEPQWRDGTALQNIAPEGMAPFHEYFVDERGWQDETFWTAVGHSVILLQIVIAAGYYVAPLLDRRDLKWPKWVCLAAWFGAMNFHVGAEYLELQIGWFSYYMLIAACVFLLPRKAVASAGRLVARPAQALVRALTGDEKQNALPIAVGVALITGLAGYTVDMPGALVASIAVGVLLIVLVAVDKRIEPLPWIAGTALAALAMWIAFVGTEARYDYYRFVGGDHRRRGELEEALEAYVKANDYAPEDDDRREREDEVRRQLGLPPRWSD
jgi:hypothetical protein